MFFQHGFFSSFFFPFLVDLVSIVKKKVAPGNANEAPHGEDSMDHSGTAHSVDVLVVRFQQSSPECPGMLSEQKVLRRNKKQNGFFCLNS